MKKKWLTGLLPGLLLLATLGPASATLYYEGTPGIDTTGGTSLGTVGSPTILDGNPVGTWNTMNLTGLSGSLASLTVTLDVSGGVNSGLYAYLVHDGVVAVLLNRPGVSAATPLGDLSSGFITSYTTIDANSGVSPFAVAGSFTSSGPTTALATTFGGSSLTGEWTLYFADVVSGGGNAALNGWSLNLTVVPEPVNVALGMFGGVLAVWSVGRHLKARTAATKK